MPRFLILVVLFALLVAVRVTAPTDFLDGDQEKQVGYVMDILHQSDWLVQYEIDGEVATKPPFYNWCAAACCRVLGSEAEWAMKLPSLLAGAGLLVCISLLARKFFDGATGFYACVACIASHHFSKLFWFARTDMLLTFTVYLAITLLVCVRPSVWKSMLLGAVLAASALTKGPVGPTLYLIFLFLWNRRQQTLRDPAAWHRMLPGLAVFTVLAGAWLVAVWNMPSFQERVVAWQLGTRMVESRYMDPVYYYFGHIFTRIVPWTFVAVLAVIEVHRRPEWENASFVAIWACVFFAFFSAIPFKRHDLLLPVYPAVFLLAGLGLKNCLEPVVSRRAAGLLYPLAIALGCGVAWAVQLDIADAVWMTGSAAACGAVGLILYHRGQALSLAAAAAGLVLLHGAYHHWTYAQTRGRYADLQSFTRQVEQITGVPQDVLVYRVNPLIAYELRQHRFLVTPDDVAASAGEWLIAPPELKPALERATHCQLTAELSMQLPPRRDQAQLFRIIGRNAPTAQAAAGATHAVR